MLELFSCLVTDPGSNDHTPIASVMVIAQAEEPRIQVLVIQSPYFEKIMLRSVTKMFM